MNLDFIAEIKERERDLMSKSIKYFDKSLMFLSATSGSISIASFTTVIGALLGIASANFNLALSMSTGIFKKLLKTTRNKKKEHNKSVMLARSKLNNIESKIYEALIYNENSNEDFTTIINEEKNYQELKESIRCCRWTVKEVIMKKLIWLKQVKKSYWWSY